MFKTIDELKRKKMGHTAVSDRTRDGTVTVASCYEVITMDVTL